MSNPCLSCGACCAHFRVAFHWREADDASCDGVPVHLTDDLNSTLRIMRGTGSRQDCRCVALVGRVGAAVRCSIHPQRPSPCREFSASWSAGQEQADCDRARAVHGLPPLGPADWLPEPDDHRPLEPQRPAI